MIGSGIRSAGIDIGSRSIKFVVVENSQIVETRQTDSGFDQMTNAKAILKNVGYDRIMATGYGRHLFEVENGSPAVTEIKAYAVGAKKLFPQVHTILDIGGQDTKAIALNNAGKIIKFEMNDRCAAGTGKFLEIMARALGYTIEDFGQEAMNAEKDIHISSICTVFAESEVTSLLAKGENRQEIALGIHSSVARRAVGMLKRVSVNDAIVFAGGVAKNLCMAEILKSLLNQKILIPDEPQFVGAFGAALLAESL